MKNYISIVIALIFTGTILAQEKPVKIVFDVTSSNTDVHQSTVRHVKAMSEAYPDSEFEVVMYGGSIDMVLKNKSTVAKDIADLAKNEHITFLICGGTMKRHKIEPSQIINGVSRVPDGILEIVQKQQEGWGYIKEDK
ncbi:DsrE family protein [Thalassobellus suaedae]|uniref:DsrE family protein n=1 Tax=Thalassobellus suaedae TaxID=3074124 RepID=A0ABY9XV34_9FLAO|nr:DsrE family protein [Flavobacteriaceae bacterium HL-DH14]